LRNNSGSLVILLAAIRRVSFAEQLGRRSPAGLMLEIDIGERLAAMVAHDEHASNSSIDQGGGKRRSVI
jgi:hypothetical protein